MKNAFTKYFIYILFLEIIFHFACFKGVDLLSSLFITLVAVIVSVLLTTISSLIKHKLINRIVMRTLIIVITLLFSAELVYYCIYESFFSFGAFHFAGALVGGYDKIFKTIFHNIIYILLFIAPTVYFVIKIPTADFVKSECGIFSLLMVLCTCYLIVFVQFVDTGSNNSLYNLVHLKNLPELNVKKMGLFASSALSLERKVFGFKPKLIQDEDILNNKKTYLVDKSDKKYNINSNIDFDTLINNAPNDTVKSLHRYFASQDATEQNDFTGRFQDYNVIFIIAESFDEIAIDPILTPTLYKLKNEGIIFNNYFAPKYPASTADGEYMLEWGTLPIIGENYSLIDMVYNVDPYILPRSLKEYDYKTYVYHNYFGYYNLRSTYFGTLNFDGHRYCTEGIDTKCEFFHGSDIDLMDQSIDDYLTQDKFYAHYITLSGHGSYDNTNFVAEKNLDRVVNLPYSYQVKYYLAANIEFDIAMSHLLTKLEDAGRLDDTLIVISSDHTPYYLSNKEVSSVSKIDRDNKFDRNRGSLIIYNSGFKDKVVVDKYAMNIDVLPTLLNMLNIPYDSRIIIGKDIMAPNSEGVAILPDRSWSTDKGSYDTANGEFYPKVDTVDDKYIKKIMNEVNSKYDISVSMQYNDYYKYIFG